MITEVTKPSRSERIERLRVRIESDKRRYRENPHAYIFEAVKTKDEHDQQSPIKCFPDKDYLHRLLDIWWKGESVEFLIKSRQLMVTWLGVAYISWIARFHDHRAIFVQSKKEEDANMLVFHKSPEQARLSFIESNLPDWLRQDIKYHQGQAIYPNGSNVDAIPQGSKHYESRVPSFVFCDEASLQDEWKPGYAAARPCIDGGGRYVGVATVRMPSAYSEEMWTEDDRRTSIIRGMWKYRTDSGVSATALHYSADPDKDPDTDDGRDWYDKATAGYIGGVEGHYWRQHMELDFEASHGTKLIPFFDKARKSLIVPPISREKQLGWTYYAGFDYGKRNKTVLGVYAIDPTGTRHIIHEIAGPGEQLGGVPGIARRIKECPYFEDIAHNIKADPSIWNDNQAKSSGGYTSIAQLLSLEGVHLQRAPMNGSEADVIASERLLHWYWEDPERPKLVFHSNCRVHISQFSKLRYRDWTVATQIEHGLKEELVDRDNDSWDAWKYAECARPSPAIIERKPPPNSFEAIRRSLKATARRPPKRAKRFPSRIR